MGADARACTASASWSTPPRMPTAGAAISAPLSSAGSSSWPVKSARSRMIAQSVLTWAGPTALARPRRCRKARNAAASASAMTRPSFGKPAAEIVCPGALASRKRRSRSAG
eukprot:10757339-Alexandrium_andersonii.AAC.1